MTEAGWKVTDLEFATAVWETQLVRYHGVAALFFIVYDILLTWSDEVEYIWSQPIRSPTKWVFLLTRYFGLLMQTRLTSVNLMLAIGAYDAYACRMMYITLVMSGGILMACIQSLLMLRAYALYIQNRRVAIAMITLLVTELAVMPAMIHLTIEDDMGRMCMKPIHRRDIVLFGVSCVLPQMLVVGMTVGKFLSGLRAGWGKIPIVLRLVRDDMILVSVIWAVVIIGTVALKYNVMYTYIGYYWLISLVPSVGCRVVINMQKIATEHAQHCSCDHTSHYHNHNSTPQLTSCLFEVPSLYGSIAPSRSHVHVSERDPAQSQCSEKDSVSFSTIHSSVSLESTAADSIRTMPRAVSGSASMTVRRNALAFPDSPT